MSDEKQLFRDLLGDDAKLWSLQESIASLEGCTRESTNRIVAALLINAFYQTPTDLNLSPMAILERYTGILKELEGGK